MADRRIIDYIRENMQRGFSADSIKQALAQQGWNSREISEAFNEAHGYGPPQQPEPQPQSPYGPPRRYDTHDSSEPRREMPAQQQPGPSQHPQQAQQKEAARKPAFHRPTGVTIICVLGFISALGGIFIGLLGVLFTGLFAGLLGAVGGEAAAGAGSFASLGFIISLMPMVLGIVQLVAFFMLLKMKKMGFVLVLIIEIIQIVVGVMTMALSMFLVPLALIIVIYLLLKRDLFVY